LPIKNIVAQYQVEQWEEEKGMEKGNEKRRNQRIAMIQLLTIITLNNKTTK
jgi:hypothetical protein